MIKKNASWFLLLGLLPLIFAGCSSLRTEPAPIHDEVLVFDLAYDLTYLRTIEALESLADWDLEATEKEKGLILGRNMNFSNLADADNRLVTLQVKRVSRKQTSVQLHPRSQRVVGGEEILQRIEEYVSREL